MVTTTIPVEGTFDIARGRLSLRTHIAVYGWPPVFAARASAVLTAIGELILTSRANRVIPVKIEIITEDEDRGIAFDLALPLSAYATQWEQALSRVERAADGFDAQETASSMEISAWITV